MSVADLDGEEFDFAGPGEPAFEEDVDLLDTLADLGELVVLPEPITFITISDGGLVTDWAVVLIVCFEETLGLSDLLSVPFLEAGEDVLEVLVLGVEEEGFEACLAALLSWNKQ